MHLFSGSSHPALAASLAAELGVPLGKLTTKLFSCGERYVRFEESVRGKDVYLLQTAGKHPNQELIELFLLCQAAKLSFAKTVHVILPHMPYSRQDRVAEPREAISAKLIADLLEKAGADHMIVLELHSDQIQGFFSIPADSISSRKIFAEEFKKKKLKDPVVVAPDAGGAKRAKKFADLLGAELAILHKSRPKHHEVEMLHVIGDIQGKTCILYDDIIDTAGTLLTAKKALLAAGANAEIYAAATHAVFSGKAIDRLTEAAFTEVVVTDSVPTEAGSFPGLRILPIAPLLADVIRHIESGQSVSEIYQR